MFYLFTKIIQHLIKCKNKKCYLKVLNGQIIKAENLAEIKVPKFGGNKKAEYLGGIKVPNIWAEIKKPKIGRKEKADFLSI